MHMQLRCDSCSQDNAKFHPMQGEHGFSMGFQFFSMGDWLAKNHPSPGVNHGKIWKAKQPSEVPGAWLQCYSKDRPVTGVPQTATIVLLGSKSGKLRVEFSMLEKPVQLQ